MRSPLSFDKEVCAHQRALMKYLTAILTGRFSLAVGFPASVHPPQSDAHTFKYSPEEVSSYSRKL